jgi:hypothetical protein
MRAQALLLTLLTLAAARPALTKTFAVDDTGTLPYDSPLALKWQLPSPRAPVDNRVSGTLTVRVRLNLTPFLRHAGRIYLVLPAQQPGPMTVSWTTQGRLLPGTLVAGGRALVYSGPITSPFLEDVLQLTLVVDARRMQQEQYHVNFNFEMDEE